MSIPAAVMISSYAVDEICVKMCEGIYTGPLKQIYSVKNVKVKGRISKKWWDISSPPPGISASACMKEVTYQVKRAHCPKYPRGNGPNVKASEVLTHQNNVVNKL